MASGGIVAFDYRPRSLGKAEAFVLTHAFAGVVRGLLGAPERLAGPALQEVEDALVRLALTFMGPVGA